MFDNIVVGVDEYEGGLETLRLAKMLAAGDGEIAVVYVEVVPGEPAPDTGAGLDAERQRFGLERLERLRDEAQIAAEVARIRASSARRGLYDFAAGRTANLIVIGGGSRNPVTRMVLGDEAREVLEDAPCAVAVAPRGYDADSGGLRKIGVAYDGSPGSGQALALARRIATERGATLSAFEAVPAPIYAHDPWDVEREIDDDVREARQRIAKLGDVEPHAECADDAVEGLRRYGASVDLLVLGSHKHRPLDGVLQRSKAQRLADALPRRCSCSRRRAAMVRTGQDNEMHARSPRS